MDLKLFKEYIAELNGGSSHRLIPLQQQLQKYKYSIEYHKAFSEPIYGTYAYFHACSVNMPVFHKMQRPPEQILALLGSDNKMRWLLLSEKEAKHVRNHLREQPDSFPNVWLIHPDGSLFLETKTSDAFPFEAKGAEEGLLEINVFAGRASYLDKHQEYTTRWLADDTDIKTRFLKLKTFRNHREAQIFRSSPPFLKHSGVKGGIFLQMARARAEREELQNGDFYLASENEAQLLTARQIRWVKGKCVPLLRGDQLKHLQPFHVPFVTAAQVSDLPLDMVEYLKYPAQIFRENGGCREYLLNVMSIPHSISSSKRSGRSVLYRMNMSKR